MIEPKNCLGLSKNDLRKIAHWETVIDTILGAKYDIEKNNPVTVEIPRTGDFALSDRSLAELISKYKHDWNVNTMVSPDKFQFTFQTSEYPFWG